jgi:hypothetical protein
MPKKSSESLFAAHFARIRRIRIGIDERSTANDDEEAFEPDVQF